MTGIRKPPVGSLGWLDLTVDDAEGLADFYRAVVGWTSDPVDMGGYSDHMMANAAGEPCAGVCHARGANAGLPAQWLIYVTVADLAVSLAAAVEQGGEVVQGPRSMEGYGTLAVIRDPAGAVMALVEPPAAAD